MHETVKATAFTSERVHIIVHQDWTWRQYREHSSWLEANSFDGLPGIVCRYFREVRKTLVIVSSQWKLNCTPDVDGYGESLLSKKILSTIAKE